MAARSRSVVWIWHNGWIRLLPPPQAACPWEHLSSALFHPPPQRSPCTGQTQPAHRRFTCVCSQRRKANAASWASPVPIVLAWMCIGLRRLGWHCKSAGLMQPLCCPAQGPVLSSHKCHHPAFLPSQDAITACAQFLPGTASATFPVGLTSIPSGCATGWPTVDELASGPACCHGS